MKNLQFCYPLLVHNAESVLIVGKTVNFFGYRVKGEKGYKIYKSEYLCLYKSLIFFKNAYFSLFFRLQGEGEKRALNKSSGGEGMKAYFKVPNKIFETKLTPIEFCVLCYLCRCRNETTQECYPSKRNIARSCNIAVSSVSKAVKNLAEKNMIEVTHNYVDHAQQSNSYRILI